jgi:hypothetical protein
MEIAVPVEDDVADQHAGLVIHVALRAEPICAV